MANPAKAELREVDLNNDSEINQDKWVTVQFNPENLKVTYANQVTNPSGGDQNGPSTRQFVGAGTTKLALQIWFDVTSPLPEKDSEVNDVRDLTKKVAYFITPKPDAQDATKLAAPAVRFLWGSFKFDGMMDSLEETLEFFSPEGRPLRASMSFTLSQQKIQFLSATADPERQGRNSRSSPGTTPLAQSREGDSLQNMADARGLGGNWQAIASANGIEDPRNLTAGALIDFKAGVSVSGGVSAGVTAGVSAGASAGASASAGFSAGASAGAGASASFGFE
jgi:hypothetical protein